MHRKWKKGGKNGKKIKADEDKRNFRRTVGHTIGGKEAVS